MSNDKKWGYLAELANMNIEYPMIIDHILDGI